MLIKLDYSNKYSEPSIMSKDKNHSSKNQNHKNHQNGIKKPRRQKYASLKGVNQKFLRNRRRCVRSDPNIKRPKSLEKRVQAQRDRQWSYHLYCPNILNYLITIFWPWHWWIMVEGVCCSWETNSLTMEIKNYLLFYYWKIVPLILHGLKNFQYAIKGNLEIYISMIMQINTI